MQNIQTFSQRTTPVEPPGVMLGAENKSAPSRMPASHDPAGFASLLQQSRSASIPMRPPEPPPAAPPVAAAPAPTAGNDAQPGDDAATKEPSADADTAEAPNESDSASRARVLLRSRLRAADGTAPAGRGDKAAPTDDTTTMECPAAQEAATGIGAASTGGDRPAEATPLSSAVTQGAADPALLHWLAGIQRGGDGAADAADAIDPKTSDTHLTGASRSHTDATRHAAAELRSVERKESDRADRNATPAGASTGPLADLMPALRFADKAGPSRIEPAKASSEIGAHGAVAFDSPATASSSDLALPLGVSIATPIDAPDFARELGLSLSVLAKDGIQQAELHLNPADMGPVSVQIVMDGTQARIDFGADVAATRLAIEAGLPELAGALRDAGFTLAGGGVSQHGSGRGGNDESQRSSGRRALNAVASSEMQRAGAAAQRIVARGGIDLFA